ncbi:MAG: RES domain-containing protein [Smithellaceae bacterium]
MACCEQCFDEEHIIEFIKEFGTKGDCDYCSGTDVYIADLSDVGKFIRECINKAYEDVNESGLYWDPEEKVNTAGQSIEEILIDEYSIFSEEIIEADEQSKLLGDLLSKSGPSWRDLKDGDSDPLDGGSAILVLRDEFYGPDSNKYEYSWQAFKQSVKHHARFFDLGQAQDRDAILEPVLLLLDDQSITLPLETTLWRAREEGTDIPKSAKEIQKALGPPPLDKAKHSRMSPSGISYMYLSDTPETCLAEIKPDVGTRTWLGQFLTKKDLKILDLADVRAQYPDSIFSPDYDHDKNWATNFLKSFAHEISRPFKEESNALGYVPTQVFTELIRSKGYDGIKYKSSQRPTGTNFTLFCGPVESYTPYDLPTVTGIICFTDWMRLTLLRTVSIQEIDYKAKSGLFDREQNFAEADMSAETDALEAQQNPFGDTLNHS